MAKGGSKVATGIISFLLGFLFALIVEIGAIVGVVVYVMRTDLETLLDNLGMGDNKYINTDPDTGGAATLGDLISGVKNLVIDEDGGLAILGKSFDDISALIPATDMLLDMVYDAVGGYISLDEEEFESTPLNGLAQVLSNSVMYTETYGLLEKLGMDSLTGDDANVAIKALLIGAEAEYATVTTDSSLTLPVLNDIYVKDADVGDTVYFRKYPYNGISAYPSNLGNDYAFLNEVKDAGDQAEPAYRLYYVPCRVTENGISEASYGYSEYVIEEGTGSNKKTYKFDVLTYGDDTDFIAVKPDADGKFILDYDAIWATLNQSAQGASDRFSGYSYYEDYARNYFYSFTNEDTERPEIKAICGYNYFKNNAGERIDLDPLTLTDVISDTYSPLYSVPVSSLMNGDDDIVDKLFGDVSLGALMDGAVDMQKIVDDVEISAFIGNVTPDNKIMANIVYKLSDINTEELTATYDKGGPDEQPCKITLGEDGCITEVKSSAGTSLGGTKISDLATVADDLAVTAIMDVKADDAILMYVGYGVADVNKQSGSFSYTDGNGESHTYYYTHTGRYYRAIEGGEYEALPCYIAAGEDGMVTNVWYYDAAAAEEYERYPSVGATTVNDISPRISSLTEHVALPGVIDVDPTQSIMTYVGYGITDVKEAESETAADALGNSYAYTGKYKTGNKVTVNGAETDEVVDCYISLASEGGKIASAWYIDGGAVKYIYGTKIKDVSDRIESMKDDMKLGEIITIQESDPKMIKALADTPINGLNAKIQSLTVGEILEDDDIAGSPMLKQLKNAKIVELAAAIDKLLIQQIYANEIYALPSSVTSPMEVVAYNSSYKYYTIEGGVFTPVSGNTTGDGVLTQDTYNSNKGTTTYYTYGLSYIPTDEEAAGLEMKIVGYDSGTKCGEWIYYTKDEESGEFVVAKDGTALLHPTSESEVNGTTYYSYGPAKGMWKLILYKSVTTDSETPATTKYEAAYTINNFNDMITYAASNVYNATLGELQEAGVIESKIDLTGTYTDKNNNSTKLSEMTFKKLIEIIVGLSTPSGGDS